MSDLLFGEYGPAKKARDKALERVKREEWRQQVYCGLPLIAGFVGTWEEIRLRLISLGLVEKPHHHNAWGGVCFPALKKGLVVRTGQLRHMKTERSHGRLTPVYRVIAT